jgi:hypothetical protein
MRQRSLIVKTSFTALSAAFWLGADVIFILTGVLIIQH